MFETLLARARSTRWVHLGVVNLRFLIAFAFIPAALKKLLDQPFTDPSNHGPFHDFLHALQATGWFYQVVGIVQLVAATLLFTQRFATIGALMAIPVLTAITAFCWSTRVIPTAIVATLMLLGTVGLLLWDFDKWRGVFASDRRPQEIHVVPPTAAIDLRLWTYCGVAILVLYLGTSVLHGGVYRPRRIDLSEPAFYVLPAVLLLPIITFVIDRRRARKKRVV